MAKLGRPEVMEPKSNKITIRLNDQDYQMLLNYCSQHRKTISKTILDAFRVYMSEASE